MLSGRVTARSAGMNPHATSNPSPEVIARLAAEIVAAAPPMSAETARLLAERLHELERRPHRAAA